MIARLVSIAAVALAVAPASGYAQSAPIPAPAVPSPDAVRLGLGREIAALLNSDEVTKLQFDKMFAETIPKAYMANPDMAELEKKYPGIVAYIIAELRPPLERITMQRVPDLVERLAPIYATMSEAELRRSLAFYRSPTGVWLIDRVARGADFSAMMARLVDDPDAPTTEKDFDNALRAATPGLMSGMTPERQRDILSFGASTAGVKLRALNPLLGAATTKWTNESDPEGEKLVGDVVIKAVQDYMARAGRKPKGSTHTSVDSATMRAATRVGDTGTT